MKNLTDDQIKDQINEAEQKIKQLKDLMETARTENRTDDVLKYQKTINMVSNASKNYRKYLTDRMKYFEHG